MINKICKGCNLNLDLNEFHKSKNAKDGRQTKCKICVRNYQEQYRLANIDSIRAKDRTRHISYRNDPVVRENYRRLSREWKKANPIKANEQWHTYNVLKLNAFVESVDIQTLRERHSGICGICDQFVDERGHIDHVIPLSKGGEHSYANTQLSHAYCNMSKSNRIVSP